MHIIWLVIRIVFCFSCIGIKQIAFIVHSLAYNYIIVDSQSTSIVQLIVWNFKTKQKHLWPLACLAMALFERAFVQQKVSFAWCRIRSIYNHYRFLSLNFAVYFLQKISKKCLVWEYSQRINQNNQRQHHLIDISKSNVAKKCIISSVCITFEYNRMDWSPFCAFKSVHFLAWPLTSIRMCSCCARQLLHKFTFTQRMVLWIDNVMIFIMYALIYGGDWYPIGIQGQLYSM